MKFKFTSEKDLEFGTFKLPTLNPCYKISR